jgi:hypothetical protein
MQTTQENPPKQTEQNRKRRIKILTELQKKVETSFQALHEISKNKENRQYTYPLTDIKLDQWWEDSLTETADDLVTELTHGAKIEMKHDQIIEVAIAHLLKTHLEKDNPPPLKNKDKLLAFDTRAVRQWFKEKYGNLEAAAWDQAIQAFLASFQTSQPDKKLQAAFDSEFPGTIWKNGNTISVQGLKTWIPADATTYHIHQNKGLHAIARMAQALATDLPLSHTEARYPIQTKHNVKASEIFSLHPGTTPGIESLRFYKTERCDITLTNGLGEKLREKFEAYAKNLKFRTNPKQSD